MTSLDSSPEGLAVCVLDSFYFRDLANVNRSQWNATASPLLRLLAELRNETYGYVFDYNTLYLEEGEGGRCIYEGLVYDTAADAIFRAAHTLSTTLAPVSPAVKTNPHTAVLLERVTEPLSLTWIFRQTRAETVSFLPKRRVTIRMETREPDAAAFND